MKPLPDKPKFGQRIGEIRRAKGLRQKHVVARISNFYGDESSYRRVENSKRTPDRDAAIAILVQGLSLREVGTIDSLLALLGYDGLTTEEVRGIEGVPASKTIPAPVLGDLSFSDFWQRMAQPGGPRLAGIVLVLIAIAFTGFIAVYASKGQSWFTLVTGTMYAGLYVVSLCLESAYEPRSSPIAAALFSFGFMLSTSVAALVLDGVLVDSGKPYGLFPSLLIFISAAILQWIIVRPVLADHPIVEALFQSHTAQSAHLKNTAYFLIIVVLFWVPPAHCVSVLRREARLGHVDFVRDMLGHSVLIGRGIVCLSFTWLVIILLVMIPIVIYMGAHLNENLKPHPKLNRYHTLFYTRAILYFLLTTVCLGWYGYSTGQLLP
jgi:transcriptional regulator with XRE-family HTH domain